MCRGQYRKTMLKFTTTSGLQVHIAPGAIREIVIDGTADKATVYTERNQYETDVKTAKTLLADNCPEKGLEHLATSISRLTEMIRARVR